MNDRGRGEEWFLSIVSGRRQGATAAVTRAILSAAEPAYAAVMLGRNLLYSRRLLKAAHADRPVISVGNLTTGGTGKTPIVAWLAELLRIAGRRPAVLLRGYQSKGGSSDEEVLLRRVLNESGAAVPVRAGADRYASSAAVLADDPAVDVFLLDDGLQHRRLARHFDLALIDATAPFGFGHVLPRGLLREPMRALRRVNAVIITRPALADAAVLAHIERQIRAEQADVPLYRADFVQDRLIDASDRQRPIDALAGKRFFAFCGIGNPDSFLRQLDRSGGERVGARQFADHHAYTEQQISSVIADAKGAGAELVLTTEKDWVKVAPLIARRGSSAPGEAPIWRVGLSVRFHDDGGNQLIEQVMDAVKRGDELLGWRKKA